MASRLRKTAFEIANDLYQAGVIDAVTMREYEALILFIYLTQAQTKVSPGLNQPEQAAADLSM